MTSSEEKSKGYNSFSSSSSRRVLASHLVLLLLLLVYLLEHAGHALVNIASYARKAASDPTIYPNSVLTFPPSPFPFLFGHKHEMLSRLTASPQPGETTDRVSLSDRSTRGYSAVGQIGKVDSD
jgi:hypothetical protein